MNSLRIRRHLPFNHQMFDIWSESRGTDLDYWELTMCKVVSSLSVAFSLHPSKKIVHWSWFVGLSVRLWADYLNSCRWIILNGLRMIATISSRLDFQGDLNIDPDVKIHFNIFFISLSSAFWPSITHSLFSSRLTHIFYINLPHHKPSTHHQWKWLHGFFVFQIFYAHGFCFSFRFIRPPT